MDCRNLSNPFRNMVRREHGVTYIVATSRLLEVNLVGFLFLAFSTRMSLTLKPIKHRSTNKRKR